MPPRLKVVETPGTLAKSIGDAVEFLSREASQAGLEDLAKSLAAVSEAAWSIALEHDRRQ